MPEVIAPCSPLFENIKTDTQALACLPMHHFVHAIYRECRKMGECPATVLRKTLGIWQQLQDTALPVETTRH